MSCGTSKNSEHISSAGLLVWGWVITDQEKQIRLSLLTRKTGMAKTRLIRCKHRTADLQEVVQHITAEGHWEK